MAIFLQAYAELTDDKKLSVTLKIIEDLNSVTEKTIIVNDHLSKLLALPDSLYNSASGAPINITKKEFQKFVKYTAKLELENFIVHIG